MRQLLDDARVDVFDGIDLFLLLEEEVCFVNNDTLQVRKVKLWLPALEIVLDLADGRHDNLASLALACDGEVGDLDVCTLCQRAVDVGDLLRQLAHVSKHENLGFEQLAVDAQDTSDGERSGLASAILALRNQMLILLVFSDNQRDRVRLNPRRLLETELFDDVSLDVLGNRELWIVPRLALIDEGTRDVAGVLVLDQLDLLDSLVLVLLQIEVFLRMTLFLLLDLMARLHLI